MAWRLAKSLETLRSQINTHYPKRSKVSDGTIGDAAHAKTKSDHNPKEGVVCAFDITNDPKNGPDLVGLVPLLLKDHRTRYVIFNSRIYNPSIQAGAARTYSGKNAHRKHLHLSVNWTYKDQTQDWTLAPTGSAPAPVAPGPAMTLKEIQSALLSLGYAPGKVDGILGKKTVAAVKAFQTKAKILKVDGIPGPMTVRALQKALEPLKQPPVSPTTEATKPAVEAPVASEQTMNKPDPVKNAPQWAIALYESLGWSHIQAVALTANLMWESGGNRFNTIHFDAHGDRDSGGVARSHGAGQWNEKAGRYKLLTDFATRRGKTWKDPETQLLFLDHELHTTERRAGVLLRAAQNIEEAIAACIQVWRPSIPHTDKRLAIARKLMGV
jgi:hypothetical protein